ncbi:MAG: ABC transporter permease [Burkholderiaceae bacterium]
MTPWLGALALPLLLLAIWTAITAGGHVNTYLLPSPQQVLAAATDMAYSGALATHVAASGSRALGGFLLTALIALPLAAVLAAAPRWHRRCNLVLEFLRVVPPLALIPLLILWLGIGEAAKFSIVALASFFPIFLNAVAGLRQADQKLVELAASLELNRRERLWHIHLPAALPSIFTGLRLGFGYSWRALVGAELIAASAGLGFLIGESAELARTDRVFVGIFAIATLGIVGDLLFQWLIRCVAPWTRPREASAHE